METHRKIQIKKERKGTFARFFNNLISAEDAGTDAISYLVLDLSGNPIRIADTEEQARFIRNKRNNFVINNSVNIITGRTISQTLNYEISNDKQGSIREDYINKNVESFGKKSVSAVFFIEREVTDFYVDFGISRTIESLNTLSVHNNVIGETPNRESSTGVLFGKLEARQKIIDENGDKVIIPLANVPVAVFTSSEEFRSVSSADEDGNRITLNIKENSKIGMYFNQDSFDTDQIFLSDNSSINVIPEKYKHTAFTNENGEFVIFDVPVGEQVFLFEIDMLKQGLTKDEVSLNFFNYPAEDEPNVDSVPHFFYRQIPVNIVPSWGDFQSGYTELNVSVPLDLRKWSTYYASPMSFAGVSLSDRQSHGHSSPLTFRILDMAKSGFTTTRRIEVAEINDLLNKDEQQQLMWNEEFKQIKNKAEFRKNDYQAFKLPANLYDPEGIGTNNKKGVWLCAYELKMFYQDDSIYKATGFERYFIPSGGVIERSHFDLNRHTTSSDINTLSASTGTFPYEQPWTINYPIKYSIPKIPTIINPNKTYDSGGNANSIKEPKWLDGDRVGGPLTDKDASGYGLQNMEGVLNVNLFSQRTTAGVIFKYEDAVRWDDEYSSGYKPLLDAKPGQTSVVVNGEKYQRLEAGYGYWLKPEGWPRIDNNAWGDHMLTSDFTSNAPPTGMAPPTYNAAVTKFPGEIIAIKLDDTISPAYLVRGAIDIYRVVEPGLLAPPGPPVVSKFVNVEFQSIYVQNGNTASAVIKRRTELIVDTANDRVRYAAGEGSMTIRNNGILTTTVLGTKINPGQKVSFDNKIISGLSVLFPANASYDSEKNSYDRVEYTVAMTINIPGPAVDITQSISISADADTSIPNKFIASRVNNAQTKSKIKSNGILDCKTNGSKTHDVTIDGLVFISSLSSIGAIFVGNVIVPDCTNNIPHKILN